MTLAEQQRIKVIGQMAKDAGIIDDPQWLERLNEPVPLWVILDLLLKWTDRIEQSNGPYD